MVESNQPSDLSTTELIFKFYDEFNMHTLYYWLITVSIVWNPETIEISYEHEFVLPIEIEEYSQQYINNKKKSSHPFEQKVDDIIVAKNSLIEILLTYLQMTDTELNDNIGHSTLQNYRRLLLETLNSFNIKSDIVYPSLFLLNIEVIVKYNKKTIDISYIGSQQTEGVIVAKNILMNTLITYLKMSDDDLKILFLHPTLPSYKRLLIKTLGSFWD